MVEKGRAEKAPNATPAQPRHQPGLDWVIGHLSTHCPWLLVRFILVWGGFGKAKGDYREGP